MCGDVVLFLGRESGNIFGLTSGTVVLLYLRLVLFFERENFVNCGDLGLVEF